MLESDVEIEPFLLSADLVATCFSTAGLDYDYLQYYSRRPLGRFLYLNIGKQIARTLEKIIGKAIVPGSENSTAIICRTRKELSTNLKYLWKEKEVLNIDVVKQKFGRYKTPTIEIYSHIQSLKHLA